MESATKDKTLYVSDMDGTLLSPETVVTPRSAELLNEAISRGALFTIATARTPATVAHLLRDVRMNLPAAVMTGSVLWHPAEGSYDSVHFHHRDEVRRLLEIYRSSGLPTFIYALEDGLIQVYHIGPLSDRERTFIDERRHSAFKRIHVPDSGESALPENLDNVLLFFAMQPSGQVERTYKRICREADCTPVFYHDMFGPEIGMLEVFAAGSSKAVAIRALADAVGADRIVAFGDNVNDLPLLRMADVAVAVENAVPEVKAGADIVIGSNAEDSVARFILEDFEKSQTKNSLNHSES